MTSYEVLKNRLTNGRPYTVDVQKSTFKPHLHGI